MDVIFTILADKEYWHEVNYYSDIGNELRKLFVGSLDKTISEIGANPFLCHNRGNGIFSVRLKGFPISVFYKIKDNYILVISICHERRNPVVWKVIKKRPTR